MAELFSNPAGMRVLASLREIFQKKEIYQRKHRSIIFVCGGKEQTSLRKQFIEWAESHLPGFICLLAEDALKYSFAWEGGTFVNLGRFEKVVALVADCVLIFPESPGSFAETGFFANSGIRAKTLVVNPSHLQSEESFLNNGPLDTFNSYSYLRPTIQLNGLEVPNFTAIGQRLGRVPRPRRERLPYQKFKDLNFKQKMLVVYEMLWLLRLADLKNLRYALAVCFESYPQYQELKHLLRILLAAKFIRIDEESRCFKVVAGLNLIEIDNFEVERVLAHVTLFYQEHSKGLYEALSEVSQ
jgi:hypothetical protein